MVAKPTYNVQGNYVSYLTGKREWKNWMTELTLRQARSLVKQGNSLCTKLRIVKVSYEVID